jgi:hypothetical protein
VPGEIQPNPTQEGPRSDPLNKEAGYTPKSKKASKRGSHGLTHTLARPGRKKSAQQQQHHRQT